MNWTDERVETLRKLWAELLPSGGALAVICDAQVSNRAHDCTSARTHDSRIGT